MHEHYAGLKSVSEIPLFHGDQWEITVPSLLGIDQDDPNAIDPKKVRHLTPILNPTLPLP